MLNSDHESRCLMERLTKTSMAIFQYVLIQRHMHISLHVFIVKFILKRCLEFSSRSILFCESRQICHAS